MNLRIIYKHRILIIFFFWSLWLSLEFLLGPYSHVRIFDAGDGFLPQLIASKIQYQKYGISYIADYMASGVDAASQFLIPFSNLNSTLFTLLPGWFAYGLLMFLQRFLASYFSFCLFRKVLKLEMIPSILGGILYSLFNLSFNSFTLYHLLGVPGIPFIIFYLHKLFQRKKNNYLYFFGFGVVVGYSNYFIYFAPYILPLIFLWFIFVNWSLKKKILFGLLAFSFGVLLIEAQSIIAVYMNSQSSQRLSLKFPDFSNQLPQVYGLAKDILFENIISIALIIISLKVTNKIGLISKRLLAASILIFLIILVYKLTQPFIPSGFGVIKSFSLGRLEFIMPFILTTTAIYLLNYSLKNMQIFKKYLLFSVILFLLILTSFKIKIETLKNYAPYRNLYLHPDLKNLKSIVGDELYRVATINGGGLHPSYALAHSLSTVDTYLTIYPKSYQDFWSLVVAKRIENDTLRYWDINYWGNKIYLWGPQDFNMKDNIDFDKNYDLDLLSKANVKYILSTKPIEQSHLKLLPSQYRTEIENWHSFTTLAKLKKFLKGEYAGPPIYIYENEEVLPRFFTIEDGEISEKSVTINQYSPDQIILSTKSLKPKILVASINYYPWWKAYVNGREVPIAKFEGTFISFDVPEGDRTVELKYLPPYKFY